MKICDLTQMYSPRGGGVRSYLLAKREFIRNHTSHEHLLIVPGERTEQVEAGRTQIWTVKGPMVNATSRYRWMMDLPALLRILYQEQPTIVEAGDPYHAAMVARNWANRRGSHFYMFYHSHFPDAILRTVLKFAGTWARAVTEQLAGDYLRNLALPGKGVFVASHHLVRVLRGWAVPRLIHLPLGVNTAIFRPVSDRARVEIRKKLGLPEDQPVVLYVGRFSPDKDTALLLRTWKKIEKLHPSKWVGVMVGDGQMKEVVERYIRNHPRVRRIPYIKHPEDLAEWYQAADLLIHPGRWETFGLVLLEAQACGLPAVAFRGGAMEEQAADLTDWPVEIGSTALAEAVVRRLASLSQASRDKAARYVLAHFSWEKTFARQMKIYESCE
ncbi:MAG: glycosyltransferase [Verrucomicrobia bacterium]|nr:glycosyltransferase [Verrucomicrobiota bacterium]